jgi:hypothetical protein
VLAADLAIFVAVTAVKYGVGHAGISIYHKVKRRAAGLVPATSPSSQPIPSMSLRAVCVLPRAY